MDKSTMQKPTIKGTKRLTKKAARKRSSSTTKTDVMEEDTQRQNRREVRVRTKGTAVDEDTTQKRETKAKGKTPSTAAKGLAPEVENAVNSFVEYATTSSMEQLRKEFKTISEASAGNEEKAHPNQNKARYPEFVCFETTRVVMKSAETSNPTDDFIHANRMKLDGAEREYIASQAPKEDQLELMWKLIFQENCPGVICLTPFTEGTQSKCEEFWPMETGGYKYYGKMFINNKKVEHQEHYTVYTLEVLPEGCSNSFVTRLAHYVNWMDQEVAASGRTILRIQKWMKTLDSGPVCVLSSAGAGRVGTFIGIDAAISKLFKGQELKVVDLVLEMRKQRSLSVSNELQYLFLYSTVLDYIRAKQAKYKPQVEKFFKAIKEM